LGEDGAKKVRKDPKGWESGVDPDGEKKTATGGPRKSEKGRLYTWGIKRGSNVVGGKRSFFEPYPEKNRRGLS